MTDLVVAVADFVRVAWDALWDALALLNWWIYKDVDDDDRWKRRRDKVTGRVKALASGRLTVEPAGAR